MCISGHVVNSLSGLSQAMPEPLSNLNAVILEDTVI